MASHTEISLTSITHTRNSAPKLKRLFESIAWIDEKIVVDMESTDSTVEIAKNFNAKVYPVAVTPRVDGIRNDFIDKGQNEWIFVLDADEYLSDDAKSEVESLINENGKEFDAFAIPRFNKISGKVLKGSGWYPDRQIRLFRKGTVRWNNSNHEPPRVISGQERLYELSPPNCIHIQHDNYEDLSDLISRQVHYAVNDVYGGEAKDFRFEKYVSEAYEQFAHRLDLEKDGELSYALASIMAWDRIIRGIIHWEKLGRSTSLSGSFSLPVTTSSSVELELENTNLKHKVAELESILSKVQSGILWKLSNRLDSKAPAVKKILKRILRRS